MLRYLRLLQRPYTWPFSCLIPNLTKLRLRSYRPLHLDLHQARNTVAISVKLRLLPAILPIYPEFAGQLSKTVAIVVCRKAGLTPKSQHGLQRLVMSDTSQGGLVTEMPDITTRLKRIRTTSPLSIRLLAWILLFSSAFTLLASGIQIYSDYRQDLHKIQQIV